MTSWYRKQEIEHLAQVSATPTISPQAPAVDNFQPKQNEVKQLGDEIFKQKLDPEYEAQSQIILENAFKNVLLNNKQLFQRFWNPKTRNVQEFVRALTSEVESYFLAGQINQVLGTTYPLTDLYVFLKRKDIIDNKNPDNLTMMLKSKFTDKNLDDNKLKTLAIALIDFKNIKRQNEVEDVENLTKTLENGVVTSELLRKFPQLKEYVQNKTPSNPFVQEVARDTIKLYRALLSGQDKLPRQVQTNIKQFVDLMTPWMKSLDMAAYQGRDTATTYSPSYTPTKLKGQAASLNSSGIIKKSITMRRDGLLGLGNAGWKNEASKKDLEDAINHLNKSLGLTLGKLELTDGGYEYTQDLPKSDKDFICSVKGELNLPETTNEKIWMEIANKLENKMANQEIVENLLKGELSPVIVFEDICIANGKEKIVLANALDIPVRVLILRRKES